uniref:Uncharacterized protein n=1 Tax=Xenopus tropicalis TaxID=8364 RepID=A0A6I8RS00_XENTR
MYPANMGAPLRPLLLLCLCLAAHSLSLPRIPMTDMEVSAMAMVREVLIFQIYHFPHLQNGSDAQIQFTIKETGCQKSDNQVVQECDFLENGLWGSCYNLISNDAERVELFCRISA